MHFSPNPQSLEGVPGPAQAPQGARAPHPCAPLLGRVGRESSASNKNVKHADIVVPKF